MQWILLAYQHARPTGKARVTSEFIIRLIAGKQPLNDIRPTRYLRPENFRSQFRYLPHLLPTTFSALTSVLRGESHMCRCAPLSDMPRHIALRHWIILRDKNNKALLWVRSSTNQYDKRGSPETGYRLPVVCWPPHFLLTPSSVVGCARFGSKISKQPFINQRRQNVRPN